MFKYEALSVLRSIGLMHYVDNLRFLFYKFYYYKRNKKFIHRNPDIKLPPSYLLYESYMLDFEAYYTDGLQSAEWIKNKLSVYKDIKNVTILDWGCGPARIVRHLPILFNVKCKICATDYNDRTIVWCKENIKQVDFFLNALEPPMSFSDNFFDIVFGLSVFTHLSETNHKKWINELKRIIKPGGILLITSQGRIFEDKLTLTELNSFRAGRLIERFNVKEGHRTFCAFQPPKYIENLISNDWEILEFTAGKKQSWGYEQDTWILKRI